MPNTRWDEYWSEWTWPVEAESAEILARRILGVSRTASVREIKSTYRALARQLHPDTNPSDETLAEKFRVIAEAYEILTSNRNLRTRKSPPQTSKDKPLDAQTYPEWWFQRFGDMF